MKKNEFKLIIWKIFQQINKLKIDFKKIKFKFQLKKKNNSKFNYEIFIFFDINSFSFPSNLKRFKEKKNK